jgi:hypothetical protein
MLFIIHWGLLEEGFELELTGVKRKELCLVGYVKTKIDFKWTDFPKLIFENLSIVEAKILSCSLS